MMKMVEKSSAVLIAAPVDDILVLRRLLRDSSYRVDPATSATQALRALTQHTYAAVVADDEALVGLAGAKLLSSVEELQPAALRVLIARRERRPQLSSGALQKKFLLYVRPYFAAPVCDALLAHERFISVASGPRHTDEAAVPGAGAAGAAGGDDTKPYAIASGGPVERRRLLVTMAEMAENGVDAGGGHAARVAAYATAMARALGLNAADVDALDEAALLHDVGELGPQAHLLRERRPLNESELRAVHAHPAESTHLAERCGLARPALLAIRHHHERWDGRGYPEGLRGGAIPLLARILAVADTWDALASERPYRGALPLGEAMRALRHGAGSQLDPSLVDLFVRKSLFEAVQPAVLRKAAMV